MMFTEAEVHQVEDIVYNLLKKENILQRKTGQTVLNVKNDVSIEEDAESFMKDKSIAIWYTANESEGDKTIHHDQLYIFRNGQFGIGNIHKVVKVLPLSFAEAVMVWELNSKGESVSTIFKESYQYSPSKSDIEFIIWALQNGKCEWMLKNAWDDRYSFDFKKFIGTSK